MFGDGVGRESADSNADRVGSRTIWFTCLARDRFVIGELHTTVNLVTQYANSPPSGIHGEAAYGR